MRETYADHEGEEADDVRVEEEVVAVLTDERDGEEEDGVGASEADDTGKNLHISQVGGDGARDGPLVNYMVVKNIPISFFREAKHINSKRTVAESVDVDGKDHKTARQTVEVVELRKTTLSTSGQTRAANKEKTYLLITKSTQVAECIVLVREGDDDRKL